MLTQYNDCGGCPETMKACAGCVRKGTKRVCDVCKIDDAEYLWDGEDFCEDCLRKELITLIAENRTTSELINELDLGNEIFRN